MNQKFCESEEAETQKVFIKSNWLLTNLKYLGMGLSLGLLLFLLFSAYAGEWIGYRQLMYQVLFSTVITLCITNSIFFSQRLLANNSGHPALMVLVYYMACFLGMFIGIELVYLLLSFIFNTRYTFFHKQDFIFCLMVTMVICTILYVRYSQKYRYTNSLKEKELDLLRQKQVNTQAALATLHAKINPHFLYNSLNAIASLIQSDPDKAEAMTLLLSKFFRYSINQSMENLVTVSEEIELVNTYLDIERIRFGNRIEFLSEIDPELLQLKIPRFLIQPLIENALKHGLNSVAENGQLRISIRRMEEKIAISVSDNGTPFPDDYTIGYGLQSTYDKLDLLYPGKYELYIRSQPVKEVVIIIPQSND